MQCPNCSYENADTAVFCANCAALIGKDRQQGDGAAQPSAPAPQGVAPPPQGAPPAPRPQQIAGTPPVGAPPPASAGWQPQYGARPAGSGGFEIGQIFFMQRLLVYIGHGSLFRRIVAGFMLATAVIVGIAQLVAAVAAFMQFADMGGAAVLGAILVFVVTLVGGYMLVHTLVIRAAAVRDLPDSSYTVIPIVAIILKLLGELSFISAVELGVQAAISAWFVGPAFFDMPMYGMGSLIAGTSVLAGVVAILSGLLTGFIALLLFYLSAEAIGVIVDIAKDIRAMRESSV